MASDARSVMSGSSGHGTLVAPTVKRTESAAAHYKTTHTYRGADGKLLVQLFTPPQVSPTYMGGSKKRGRGAVRGRVVLHCVDKDKASEVRIKLKAVVHVKVPKTSQATEGEMPTCKGLSPANTSTTTREQTLLQLDQRLRASEARFRTIPSAAQQVNKSGTFDSRGFYEWTFQFDIPEGSATHKNASTQPFPMVGTNYPSSYVLESEQPTGKKKAAAGEAEWASVKWYVKVTVERPGLFRSNDRLIVPFIYLPPPPEDICPALLRRQALGQQVLALTARHTGRFVLPSGLVEPPSLWKPLQFVLSQAALGRVPKRSLMDKMFGLKKPMEEKWALSFPGKPSAVFPLRSAIPFVLTLVHSSARALVVHPLVFLVQKVHLRARSNAAHTQYISHAKMLALPVNRQGMQQWFGVVQFPSWCTPSFDTTHLGLEYFLQVKPANTPEAVSLLTVPVGLYCPPPRLVEARDQQREQAVARGQQPTMLGAPQAVPRPSVVPRPSITSASTSDSTLVSAQRPASARVPSTSTTSTAAEQQLPPGLAGIGRAHLPGVTPEQRSQQQQQQHAQAQAQQQPAVAAAEPPPTPPRRQQSPRPRTPRSQRGQRTPRQAQSPATSERAQTEDQDALHDSILTDYMESAPAPQQEEAHESDANTVALPTDTSMGAPTDASDTQVEHTDVGIHDAGPMSLEEEEAWTRNVLANAFQDVDDNNALELPPSYFEATGIRDEE